VEGKLGNLQRKTCEPIAREAGVKRAGVQLFVGNGKWDDEAVMAEVRTHVAEVFADPEAVLVLDSSGFPKKGTESCGVRRQWCGRLGKLENCQVGVFLSCVSNGCVAPLGRRLYLPREWASNSAWRLKCRVPRHVRFRHKWQIALSLLKEGSAVPHGWIVGDDEFGRVSRFRSDLDKRGETYVLDVPCNTLVRVLDLTRSPGGRRKRKGRGRSKRARKPPFERVEEWAARQPESRWQRFNLRPAEKCPLVVKAMNALVQTRDGKRVGGYERLVVIRTVEENPRTHYCLSNAATAELQDVVAARMERHRIEEMFELGNEEIGLDHYEVRSWVGWHHHMTLSLLAMWFLVLEKRRAEKKDAGHHGAAGTRDPEPTATASPLDIQGDRSQDHVRPAA
jgi:SRSO17 transposase